MSLRVLAKARNYSVVAFVMPPSHAPRSVGLIYHLHFQLHRLHGL